MCGGGDAAAAVAPAASIFFFVVVPARGLFVVAIVGVIVPSAERYD